MPRVLLVDDDAVTLSVLSHAMERHLPLVSTEASQDPREALYRLATNQYDVVLSDFTMPGLNGLEFLRAARYQGCDASFLLLTGEATDPILAEGLRLGVFAVLAKPYELSALVPLVQQAIDCHRLRREVADLRRTMIECGVDLAGVMSTLAAQYDEDIQPLLPLWLPIPSPPQAPH